MVTFSTFSTDLYWDDEWTNESHEYSLKWIYYKNTDILTDSDCDRVVISVCFYYYLFFILFYF